MPTDSSHKLSEQTGSVSPTDAQIDKLVEVISRSQHNYRELIDNLDQAVFTLSGEGEVRVANRRLSEILGVSFQDLIHHRLDEFIDEPRFEEIRRSLPAFAESGSWTGIVPIRLKKDGALRYFNCWLQAVVDEGQITSVSGWARDVTAQHESEARFTELFQSLQEGIFFSTPEGRFLDGNPALIRLFGFDSKEELRASNIRDMYANPVQRDEIVRETAERGSDHNREIVYRRKDGTHVHCLASALAIRDHFGRVVRFQGTLVDVTARVEIERKLHREQEFNRRLIDCFPDLIVVLDREGRFTFVSERVKDILGVPPEEYLGRPIGQRVETEDQVKMAEMCDNIISGRLAHAHLEVRARHVDGTWKVLRISASPLFDENGAITGIVSSGLDVTESLLIEQQLAQREKLAAMGQMMTGAAHELNNPLTAILGVGDLLRERAPDDTTRRHVDLILQQARRAAIVVQNLLAFSRPTTQTTARLNVDEAVRQALLLEHAALTQKNIQVTFEAPSGLPAVEGDRKLLVQAFRNFITNAEQAISSVRDRGTLAVSIARVNNQIRVTFADDGGGITKENMGRIFDPFFTTTRPGGNSGLGLTICQAVIKEHGGTLEVQSTPGAGAIFQVFLPAVAGKVPATTPAPHAQTAAPQPAGGPLAGHSALIVDDEEGIREIVQEGLSARGMKVDVAASAEAALSFLESNSCDIILCDFNLPGLNGEQLFDRLYAKQGSSQPRFVFMTGDLLEAGLSKKLLEKGARILQKPFRSPALVALLVEVLEPQPSQAR